MLTTKLPVDLLHLLEPQIGGQNFLSISANRNPTFNEERKPYASNKSCRKVFSFLAFFCSLTSFVICWTSGANSAPASAFGIFSPSHSMVQ